MSNKNIENITNVLEIYRENSISVVSGDMAAFVVGYIGDYSAAMTALWSIGICSQVFLPSGNIFNFYKENEIVSSLVGGALHHPTEEEAAWILNEFWPLIKRDLITPDTGSSITGKKNLRTWTITMSDLRAHVRRFEDIFARSTCPAQEIVVRGETLIRCH